MQCMLHKESVLPVTHPTYVKLFYSLFPHSKDLEYRTPLHLPKVLLMEFGNTHFFSFNN